MKFTSLLLSAGLALAFAGKSSAVQIDWLYSFHAWHSGLEEVDYGIWTFAGTFDADIDADGLLQNPSNAILHSETEDGPAGQFTATRFEVIPDSLKSGKPALLFYWENFINDGTSMSDDWVAWQFQSATFPGWGGPGFITISHEDDWFGPVVDQYIRVREVPENGPPVAALAALLGLGAVAYRRSMH